MVWARGVPEIASPPGTARKGRESGVAMTTLLGRPRLTGDPHRERGDAVDEVGVDALGFVHDLDHREALHDFLPHDRQLHFGQPVADAPMDAEAERHVMPRPRAVDDELVR